MKTVYLKRTCSVAQPGGRGNAPRNWVHNKTPGCAVEPAWFGSQISLITAMSFREAMPPRTTHQGLCPGPRWGTSVPQTPCAPTSKSWLRHWPRYRPNNAPTELWSLVYSTRSELNWIPLRELRSAFEYTCWELTEHWPSYSFCCSQSTRRIVVTLTLVTNERVV